MGKFVNTNYAKTVDNLTKAINNKIDNPYYKFTDQHPSKVTYYNQNIEKSTLDEASGLYEAHISSKSPIIFNKIKDFIIYGLDKVALEYDAGDFGIEANSAGSGDAIILPNTIEPRPGDFFVLSYLKENLLFKVNGVSVDTLDTGANIYKIEYAAELTNSIENIEKQVDKSFSFLVDNVGTDMKSVISDDDKAYIEKIEVLIENMITIFNNLFFDSRLQTFVYNHDGYHMYDPYMIEFLMRNKVLNYGEEYIFVDHATSVNKTFSMDYNRSFFRQLELPDEEINCTGFATADLISDPNSLFVTKMDEYYCIRYLDNTPYKTRFEIFNKDILERVKSGKMYIKGSANEPYNLWINYFNPSKPLKGDIVSLIRDIDYMDNLSCFYMLPISIFILEKYVEKLLN